MSPSGGIALQGDKLRTLRENSGHSIRSLAKTIGLSYQMLGMVELGQRRASPSTAKAIADALGVTVQEIRE